MRIVWSNVSSIGPSSENASLKMHHWKTAIIVIDRIYKQLNFSVKYKQQTTGYVLWHILSIFYD